MIRLGQILYKLPVVPVPPNKTVEEQKQELAKRLGWRIIF